MKRLIIAVVVMAVILAMSTAAMIHLSRATEELLAQLEQVQNAFNDGDPLRAAELAITLNETWHKHQHIMTHYARHQLLEEITSLSVRLEHYARRNDVSEFNACAAQLHSSIHHLLEDEMPNLRSIF